jgi:hypothetical protein
VLTARSVRGVRGIVASIPLLLMLAFVAVMAIHQGEVKNVFTDEGPGRWRVPVLVIGLLIAGIGLVTEFIRAAVARKLTHAWHALVWAGAALVWWAAWFVLFNGADRGARGWMVNRVEDIHRVRLVLLIAIPGALIAYDLMRTWLSQTDRARRRQVAAVGIRPEIAAAAELAELRARVHELEQVIDLRGAPDAHAEAADVDVSDHAT